MVADMFGNRDMKLHGSQQSGVLFHGTSVVLFISEVPSVVNRKVHKYYHAKKKDVFYWEGPLSWDTQKKAQAKALMHRPDVCMHIFFQSYDLMGTSPKQYYYMGEYMAVPIRMFKDDAKSSKTLAKFLTYVYERKEAKDDRCLVLFPKSDKIATVLKKRRQATSRVDLRY